jgi:hypothetical protein
LNITRLKINDSYPRNLYACTKDGGVWVTTIQEHSTFAPVIEKPDLTINVFPNPSDGTFYISSNADSELSGEIKVINLLGMVVYADAHFDVSSRWPRVVTLNDIAAGNYILVFTSEKTSIKMKLIITRTQ